MSTAISSLFDVITQIITAITANDWLVIPFVAGIVGVAVSVIAKLKST